MERGLIDPGDNRAKALESEKLEVMREKMIEKTNEEEMIEETNEEEMQEDEGDEAAKEEDHTHRD